MNSQSLGLYHHWGMNISMFNPYWDHQYWVEFLFKSEYGVSPDAPFF